MRSDAFICARASRYEKRRLGNTFVPVMNGAKNVLRPSSLSPIIICGLGIAIIWPFCLGARPAAGQSE